MTKKTTEQPYRGDEGAPQHHLRLFVAGNEPNSVLAKAAVDRICSERLAGNCQVEVVDVLQDFRPALEERILVTPALVIRGPQRRTVIFGNLADTEKVMAALQAGSVKA